jgi:CRP/FNR family cyclic AMP-dependent transcriptional regulator
MNVALSTSAPKNDLQGLIQSIGESSADDSLGSGMLTPAQWELLAPYLQPCMLTAGQVLFAQGTSDRTLYFVESGNLSVHYEDEKARLRLAIVGPGSIVGEGASQCHSTGRCTEQALEPGGPSLYRTLQPTTLGCPGHRHGLGCRSGQTAWQSTSPRCGNVTSSKL